MICSTQPATQGNKQHDHRKKAHYSSTVIIVSTTAHTHNTLVAWKHGYTMEPPRDNIPNNKGRCLWSKMLVLYTYNTFVISKEWTASLKREKTLGPNVCFIRRFH